MLEKLHAELVAIEKTYHTLADPQLALAEKTRALLGAIVTEVQALKQAYAALSTPAQDAPANPSADPAPDAPGAANTDQPQASAAEKSTGNDAKSEPAPAAGSVIEPDSAAV